MQLHVASLCVPFEPCFLRALLPRIYAAVAAELLGRFAIHLVGIGSARIKNWCKKCPRAFQGISALRFGEETASLLQSTKWDKRQRGLQSPLGLRDERAFKQFCCCKNEDLSGAERQ